MIFVLLVLLDYVPLSSYLILMVSWQVPRFGLKNVLGMTTVKLADFLIIITFPLG